MSCLINSQPKCQLDRQIGNPAGMLFRFLSRKSKARDHPSMVASYASLNSTLDFCNSLNIMALSMAIAACPEIIFEKIQPIAIRVEGGTMENFQHTQNASLGDKRQAIIGNKSFNSKQSGERPKSILFLCKIGHIDHPALQCHPPGTTLPQF